MDRGFAVLIMAVVGGCIALQAPINAGLGKHTGSFAAATISFAVGTVLLGAIVVLSGKAGGIGEVAHVDWYLLLGGALGAAYVFSALVLVSQIGAGAVAAATVTGQLTDLGGARPDRLPGPGPAAADGQQGRRRGAPARRHLSDRSLTRPPGRSP